MYCSGLAVLVFAVLAARPGSADVYKIEVGKGGLRYTPNTIKADKGDIVEFHFDGMHSVVAGDFKKPCTPVSSGGFYSGTLPDGDKDYFSITIENTDPVFFYCAVDSHCQGGMVGVINQGSDTLDAFQMAAANSDNSVSPNAPFGGTLSSSAITSGAESSSAPTSTASKSAASQSTSAPSESTSMSMGMTTTSTSQASESTESTSAVSPTSKSAASGSASAPSTTVTPSSANSYWPIPITELICFAIIVNGIFLL